MSIKKIEVYFLISRNEKESKIGYKMFMQKFELVISYMLKVISYSYEYISSDRESSRQTKS